MRSVVLMLLVGVGSQAQWLNNRDSGIPRTKDGKPNLSAPVPRGANGKVDLSGVWKTQGASKADLVKLMPPDGINGLGEDDPPLAFFNVLADFKPEEMPMRPEVAVEYQKRAAIAITEPPPALCVPPAVPIVDSFGPFKIVQTPKLVLMLFEADTFFRQIFMDGRKHPEDPQPSWLGYSTGKWEGDSLVVETVGLNPKAPLDIFGHPHSEAMRVTERFRRRDFGHMDLQITIDDPKTYTKPFTYKIGLNLIADTDLLESFCIENETDLAHMKKQ